MDLDPGRGDSLPAAVSADMYRETVLAGRVGDWTVLIEESGWTCTEADKAQALSAETVAVAVLRHD
ncbi:hypothetical protein [Microtetraspora niveoalba]|uniref:hypothetical protein n=1 Tax=Microtetraspora niveoalba TaxID=46175 RepID=UPI0008320EAB|nr:hypothetical protein [Microtetraspora niveoalba]